ncbi:hypothetical protein SHIRM173S_03801 [Streptomyces hirsutus]
MSHPLGTRQAQKQRTLRALLDAALELLEEQVLGSRGLREVTRAVGIAPTASTGTSARSRIWAWRWSEALESLHPLIGTAVSATGDAEERIARAVESIAGHVDRYPAHMRFIVRERHGGCGRSGRRYATSSPGSPRRSIRSSVQEGRAEELLEHFHILTQKRTPRLAKQGEGWH